MFGSDKCAHSNFLWCTSASGWRLAGWRPISVVGKFGAIPNRDPAYQLFSTVKFPQWGALPSILTPLTAVPPQAGQSHASGMTFPTTIA